METSYPAQLQIVLSLYMVVHCDSDQKTVKMMTTTLLDCT